MINMDPRRLPSYLNGATDSELATLAQEARNPAIISAVQAEMNRRRSGVGGLTREEMSTPAPQANVAQPMPPQQLADVASEGWVPPWQRNDGRGPFPALVQAGPVPDDTIPDDPWLKGARERVTPGGLQMGLQREGPVAAEDELPNEYIEDKPIWDGVDAAKEAAGTEPDAVDIPPEAVELGQALEAAADDPDAMAAILAEIQGGIQSPESMRNMAIARAGFGMAASRNPYFFGAMGEGANLGLDAYEKAQQQALMNRVRTADIQQDIEKFGEQKRATGVGEKQADTRIAQAERQMDMAEREYERKVKEYEEGRTTREALAQAEIALRQAQARYANERPRSTAKADLLTDDKGFLMRLTPDGPAEYVTDPEGNKIKGNKLGASGATAMMRNAAYLGDLLFNGDEAEGAKLLQQGKTMSPDQIRRTALAMANDAAAADPMLVDPTERQAFVDEKAREIEALLLSAKSSATAAPTAVAPETEAAPEAPAYTDPNQVKKDYQSGKITKEQARQYLQQIGQ